MIIIMKKFTNSTELKNFERFSNNEQRLEPIYIEKINGHQELWTTCRA